jgi:prephenate dehydrogenase
MHVNVTIVGLDRITASIGLAFKRYQSQTNAEHTFTIIGSDIRANPMKVSEKIGAVDNFNRSLSKAMQNADLVIFNAPPGQIDESYARLGAELKPGAVVLDLALLKQPAIQRASRHFPANDKGAPLAYLVGITPIVSINGLYTGDLEADAARADLFDNAEILVTPDTQSPSEAISLAEDVVRLMGGRPRFMDPAEHDGLIAATEALPALLGVGMFLLQQSEGRPELADVNPRWRSSRTSATRPADYSRFRPTGESGATGSADRRSTTAICWRIARTRTGSKSCSDACRANGKNGT